MSAPVLHHEPRDQEPLPAQGLGSADDDAEVLGGLAAQAAERRAKRDALQARGINPYPTRFERTATLAELHAAHCGLEPDTRTGEIARVAGRVVSMRGHGKLRFVTLEDASDAVQLMFQANHDPSAL
jgi:lysyl-tRNA synthetase class II